MTTKTIDKALHLGKIPSLEQIQTWKAFEPKGERNTNILLHYLKNQYNEENATDIVHFVFWIATKKQSKIIEQFQLLLHAKH